MQAFFQKKSTKTDKFQGGFLVEGAREKENFDEKQQKMTNQTNAPIRRKKTGSLSQLCW